MCVCVCVCGWIRYPRERATEEPVTSATQYQEPIRNRSDQIRSEKKKKSRKEPVKRREREKKEKLVSWVQTKAKFERGRTKKKRISKVLDFCMMTCAEM